MTNTPKKRAAKPVAANPTPFALSRIQAEGWNAARKYLASGDSGDTAAIAALNPYQAPVERARWYAGFNSAVDTM